MKRYKFTKLTKEYFGVTLKQIQAVADFGNIRKGDLGGYIRDEMCLPQDGSGWVYPNGVVSGGVVYGGVVRGGEVYGGAVRGGEVRGGVVWGGEVCGGEVRGGVVWGGVVRGGEVWGGVVWGGEVCGGEVSGGGVWGGVWEYSPLQIQGTKHFLNVSDEKGNVQIGYYRKHIDEWLKCFAEFGKQQGYTPEQIAEYHDYLKLAKRWIKNHKIELVVK